MPDAWTGHLEELRRRLIISLVCFVAATAIAFFFSRDILDFLILPLRSLSESELYFHRPYEAFLTHLKAACLTGFVISAPVLFTQAWLFVTPGLYRHERRWLLPLVTATLLLFLAGMAFAWFIVIPWGLFFLLGFQTESLRPLIGVGPYFSFILGMLLAFGALFDFPVAVVGAVRLGVVRVEQLAAFRKPAIVIIFILSAVLTPSPDPFSQLLMAGPLVLLYEISILVAGRMRPGGSGSGH